jgi:arylmalonate decarboxylase
MTTWIGRIEPSMWFEGGWWERMLPPDVRLAVLSLGVQRLAQEDLERAHDQILEKVEMLDREGVDVINVGGSPVVTVHGWAGHERLVEEIGSRVSRPFITALQAEMEGVRAVGGQRVAIASPYPVAQTEKRARIMEERGFEIVGHDSLDIERTRVITELDPSVVVDQAVRLVEQHPEADVVYLPCGSLPVVNVIEEIESRTGRPAVTCVQAQLAATLKLARYPSPVEGYGRLLREITAVPV